MLSSNCLFSQELKSNLRHKQVFANNDTIQIDSLSIVPGNLRLFLNNNKQVSDNEYSIDYKNASLIINRNLRNKHLTIKYRVYPINFAATYSHKDTALIIKNYNPFAVKPVYVNKTTEVYDNKFNRLHKSGSISRGFTFGNNQDVASQSNLNLQLSGKINDEVSILAAISDNNIPIQPDGNTQKIQEFDKIYVKLYKKNQGITLGDIEMQNPQGYFLKLQKRTRGLQLYSNFNTDKNQKSKLYSQLTAGVAKGKYRTLKIKGIEGNQGPYRLTGNNNGTYVVIISGSEKVYINGKLLKRGQKFDYVIDYNSAELSFTANYLITKDDRITIEYEYAQQLYPNMQFMQSNYFTSKKVDTWLNFYVEKDNKNDPLSETYTDEIKRQLAAASDNSGSVNAANVRKVEYDNNSILYKQIDSSYNGNIYKNIYVYSNNPKLAVYRVGFSYVGQNKGNYILENGKTNGKVYKWIAPKNNIPQGSYEPVNQFITPKQKIITNLGANVQTGKSGNVGFEFAISNYDANTYSNNNDVRTGYALKINTEQGLINKDTNNVSLKLFANCKLIDEKFEAAEKYNSVEFERDWNLNNQAYSPEEKSISAGLLFSKRNFGTINIANDYMLRSNNYKANKFRLNSNIRLNKTQLTSDISYLLTDDYTLKTEYLKHKFELLQHFKYVVLGASEESEDNSIKIKQTDSISNSSFKFNEYKIFMRQADSSVNQYSVGFTYRDDYSPLQKTGTAKTLHLRYDFLQNKNFKSKTVVSYRKVDYLDSLTDKFATDSYLSGRQEMYANLFKGSIRLSVFYENSSGLELKKQYQYIEVQNGQGQFTWIDYNNNNIKELDEFEVAKFSDQANYIRIFLPSNEYIRAYTTQMSSSIMLQPYKVWAKQADIKGFLAMFDNQFSCRISEKTHSPNYLPILMSADKDVISKMLSLRNNLRFTSKNRKWQLNYEYDNSNSNNLLTVGNEEQSTETNSLRVKYKIFKLITLFNTSSVGNNSLVSENFYWKNYKLDIRSNETNLQLQSSNSLYINLIYKYSTKRNKTSDELLDMNTAKVSINQKLSLKASLQADCSFILADYKGETNTSTSYQMLEGLQKGKNLVWNISYSRKLSKFFYLNVSYNGRSSKNAAVIHIGSVQLRADF